MAKIRNYEYVPGNWLIATKNLGTETSDKYIGNDTEGRALYQEYDLPVIIEERVRVTGALKGEKFVDVDRNAGRLYVGSATNGYRAPSDASQRNETYFALVAIALYSAGTAPSGGDLQVPVRLSELDAALGFATASHLAALDAAGLIGELGSYVDPAVTQYRIRAVHGLLNRVHETRHVNGSAPKKTVTTRVDVDVPNRIFRNDRSEVDETFDASGSAFTTALNARFA